jgi:hypothetical protein
LALKKPYDVSLELYATETKLTDLVYYRDDYNSYPLRINLLAGREPYPLPPGAVAEVWFTRPDGDKSAGIASVISRVLGQLKYDISPRETAAEGAVTASVSVITAGERLTWPDFTFTARGSAVDYETSIVGFARVGFTRVGLVLVGFATA